MAIDYNYLRTSALSVDKRKKDNTSNTRSINYEAIRKSAAAKDQLTVLENGLSNTNRLKQLVGSKYQSGAYLPEDDDYKDYSKAVSALRKSLNRSASILEEKSRSELNSFLGQEENNLSQLEKMFSKFKTADEYNTAFKNSEYSEKYKSATTYNDVNNIINGADYSKLDDEEKKWLNSYRWQVATSEELQKEYDTLEGLDLDKQISPKNIRLLEIHSALANETGDREALIKEQEVLEKEVAALTEKQGLMKVLKTAMAERRTEEEFNSKWGNITVPKEFKATVNTEEKDEYYREINGLGQDLIGKFFISKDGEKAKSLDYVELMDEDEKKKYNSIYETEGIEKANEYFKDLISVSLDKKKNNELMQQAFDFTSQNGWTGAVGSVGSVVTSLGSGLEYVANLATGQGDRRSTLSSVTTGLREGTKENWNGAKAEKVWDFLYDTGMSGVDSVAAVGVSAATGLPFAGEFLLGSSAAANTANDLLDRGVTGGGVVLASLAAGAAESIFEHLSIGKILDTGDITKGFTKAGIKQAVKKVSTDMLVNFTEESLTEVSNIITDQLFNGELSSYAVAVKDYYTQGLSLEEAKSKAAKDMGVQIGMAGLSGMLMGFGFGVGGSVVGLSSSQIKNSKNGNAVLSGNNLGVLKTMAKASGFSEIIEAAEKLTESSKPSEVGFVFNRLYEKSVEKSVQEMAPELMKNGATKGGTNAASSWAMQIIKSATASQKTKSDLMNDLVLRTNKVTKDVYSAFVDEGKFGGDVVFALNEIRTSPVVKNTSSVFDEPRMVKTINTSENPGQSNQSTVKVLSEDQAYVKSVGEKLGRKIVFENTRNTKGFKSDGYIDSEGVIHMDYRNSSPLQFILKHELTHFIENDPKAYNEFANAVMDSEVFKQWVKSRGYESVGAYKSAITSSYLKVDKEFNEAKANKEMLANFVGENLFGNDLSGLEQLVKELQPKQRRTFIEAIKDFIEILKDKFSKDKSSSLQIERFEKAFVKAYNAATAEFEQQKTADNGGVKYSLGLSFKEQLQQMIDGTFDKEHSHLFVRKDTPKVYLNLSKVKIPNLPIVMSYDNAAVSMFDKGEDTKSDHNHGLGIDTMAKIPQYMEDPLYIVKLKNGRINALLIKTDHKGRNYFISLELDVEKPVNEEYSGGYKGKQHLLLTAFGANKNYFNKILTDPENTVVYDKTKDSDLQGNPESNGLNIINKSESTDIIEQKVPSVNIYSTQKSEKHSLPLEDPGTLLDMYEHKQITREEYLNRLNQSRNRKAETPLDIAQMTEEDANTTPTLKRKQGEAKGNSESKTYSSLQNSDIFDNVFKEEVKKDNFVRKYQTITNRETLLEAAKKIDNGGKAFVEEWKNKKPAHMDTVDKAIGIILMDRYQRVGDYQSAMAITEKIREAGTATAQGLQLFSIIGRFDPNMMIEYSKKELKGAFEVFKKEKTKRWLDNNAKRFELTEEDIEFIRRRTLQAAELPEGRPKDILLAEIAARIQDKIPAKSGQGIKAYQRICMLLNAKTNIRNIMSNATSAPAFMFADIFGAAFDRHYAKQTGVRTTGLFGGGGIDENIKALGKGAKYTYEDWRRHINTRELDRYKRDSGIGLGEGKAFNENHKIQALNSVAKTFNSLDRLTSFLLELGDRPFYEMWFTNSLNNQLKLNNASEPTAEMIEIATEEGLQRTWQDNNKWTRSVSKIKEIGNNLNLDIIGVRFFKDRFGRLPNYGLGDVVVKYTKTPANLAKAICDFSPLGLIKACSSSGTAFTRELKKGNYDIRLQKRFVDDISKGIAGTLIQFMLYGLAAIGWISLKGKGDDDKDVSAFEKYIMGIPEYSVSAFGSPYITYEWNQPFGAFMATVADYMQTKEANPENELFDNILEGIKAGGDVILRQSFLKSLQNFFETEGLWSKVIAAFMDDPSVYVPQLIAQAASVNDDYRRSVYVGSDFEVTSNEVKNKIPGLRETLEKDVDVLGRYVPNSQGDWVNAFFNPGNSYTDTSNEIAEEVYAIYKNTGDATVIPRKAQNYIKVKNLKHTFTDEEKADYQRIMGQTSAEIIDNLLNERDYENLSDSQKVELITNVYNYATAKAKSDVVYSYEIISAMYGGSISQELYNRLTDAEKKKLAELYFMNDYRDSNYKPKFKQGEEAEYFLEKLLDKYGKTEKQSKKEKTKQKELNKILN